MQDINTVQIVGCVTMPPRRATTQNGRGMTEIEIESVNGQDRSGQPLIAMVRFVLWDAQGGEQYANLPVGQMVLVSGSLKGEIKPSNKGGTYNRIEIKVASLTVLPYKREPIAAGLTGAEQFGEQAQENPYSYPPQRQTPPPQGNAPRYGGFGQ